MTENKRAMCFGPNLAGCYKTQREMEPDLGHFMESVRWCDTLILFHPMWWGAAPAKLKGLIDRVFLPGIAFAYDGDGHFPKTVQRPHGARAHHHGQPWMISLAGLPQRLAQRAAPPGPQFCRPEGHAHENRRPGSFAKPEGIAGFLGVARKLAS